MTDSLQLRTGLCSGSSVQIVSELPATTLQMHALPLAGRTASASYTASLCLSFLIYEMEMVIVSHGVLVRIK